MNWDMIAYNIEQFWNKPIPIIGFTVGTLVVGILLIIAKTSFGKKSLNMLKAKYDEMQNKYNEVIEAKKKIEDAYEISINEMKKYYEDELAILQADKDTERKVIIALGKCINNVKVKKIIEDFENTLPYESISEVIQNVHNEYESKYELVLKELEELKNEKGKDSNTEEETI